MLKFENFEWNCEQIDLEIEQNNVGLFWCFCAFGDFEEGHAFVSLFQ